VKNIYCWVNCYGAWDPLIRDPIETIGYDSYLTSVAHAIALLGERVVGCTVSGGAKDALGRVEVDTVIPELQRRLGERGVHVAVTPDERNQVSLSSMAIARNFIQHMVDFPELHHLLFVDVVRYESNLWVVEQLAAEVGIELASPRAHVVPVARLDQHPSSTPQFQADKLALMKQQGIAEIEQVEYEVRKGR
jgi:hypothetical protein